MTRKPPVVRQPVRTATEEQRRARPLRWISAQDLTGLTDDQALLGWLSDRGSLTGRIRRLGGPGFALEVLAETVEPMTDEDRGQFGCATPELYVRRVRMSCNGVRLVFATTRVPPPTLERHQWLGRLRDRPLGEALADRDDVTRTPFEYAWVEDGDTLHADALSGTDIAPLGLWARRSRFLIQHDPILVYEVFLPGLSQFGSG